MNFNEADYVMVNTPGMLRDMASRMTAAACGSRSRRLIPAICGWPRSWSTEGVIPDPVLVQLCMGVPWGAPMT
jgi:uncharacterized protein (DUF849 family)